MAAAPTAQIHVLSIGVETHEDARISTLKYAVADAKSIAAVFRAAGSRSRTVESLTSADPLPERRPTRAKVLRLVRQLVERAAPADKVVIFFAGHGVEIDALRYLLTVETDRDFIAETALPFELLERALQGLQAGELLFILDACRNDPDAGRGDQDARLTDGLARRLAPQPAPAAPVQRRTATLLGCDVGQRTWEDPESGHGAFTARLLRGLAGAADGAGLVTLLSLSDFVQRELADWSRRTGRAQVPRLVNPDNVNMVVLIPPAEPVVSVQLQQQPLAAVVALIAEQYGAQIVLGRGVDANLPVTGRRDDQPLTTTLKVLLTAFDQTVRRQGRIYIIEKPGEGVVPDAAEPGPPTPPAQPGAPPGWPEFIRYPPVDTPGLRFRVCAIDGMPQVYIPAGEFRMGATVEQAEAAFRSIAELLLVGDSGALDHFATEAPPRVVQLPGHWMDLHKVTLRQYRRFCAATGHPIPEQTAGATDLHPVAFVSWHDAAAYVKWAGRLLPSEAQFERAARGGIANALYPWGDEWAPGRLAPSIECHVVASFPRTDSASTTLQAARWSSAEIATRRLA